MTQKRRKRSKKWIFWLIFVILLVGAGVVCYLVWDGYFKDKKGTISSDEKDKLAVVVNNKKKDNVKEEEKKEEVVEKEAVVQYEGEDPNKAKELTGVVTYAGVNSGNLIIRVNIDQYLSSGKCTLGLRRDGGNIYSAEAAIIDAASTSTCEGFNVPVAELGNGHTLIVIYLNSGDKTGEIHGEVDL